MIERSTKGIIMAININPIQLIGNWDVGYALDVHVKTSIPVGEDPFGNMIFATERSEIGELLYQFKYRGKSENLNPIVDAVILFLALHPEMRGFGSIIPVPPTPDNRRVYQPTYEIAEAVANRLSIPFCDNVLEKRIDVPLKGMPAAEKSKIDNFIVKNRRATRKHSVLIIDDLFQTGTTLKHCTQRLREDPLVDKIFVLTITKTKNQ